MDCEDSVSTGRACWVSPNVGQTRSIYDCYYSQPRVAQDGVKERQSRCRAAARQTLPLQSPEP